MSNLQTSSYKTVVKDMYFLSEHQMCENYPFLMVIRGKIDDFCIKLVAIISI